MRMRLFVLSGLLLLAGCAAQAGTSATQAGASQTQTAGEEATPIPSQVAPTQPPAQASETSPSSSAVIPLQPTATFQAPIATLPAGSTMIPLDAAPQALVDQATASLARKLGIDRADISLFLVQAVNWPDTSLGCPRSGEMYAQVITPGYQISLEADGSIYEFHTDRSSQVILCDVEPLHEIYQPP